jgi:hypothetical protein
VARALSSCHPARTWETSHLGGDRFAANLVCFPHGLYFGRVPPDQVASVADAYSHGTIDLNYYRGRSSWPIDVQAAEYWLRRETALVGVDDVRLLAHDRREAATTVRFATLGATWTVRVRETAQEAVRPLTCLAEFVARPRAFNLIDVAQTIAGSGVDDGTRRGPRVLPEFDSTDRPGVEP